MSVSGFLRLRLGTLFLNLFSALRGRGPAIRSSARPPIAWTQCSDRSRTNIREFWERNRGSRPA